MQPAGCIDNQHIALIIPGVFNCFLRGFDRILGSFFKHGNVDLLSDYLQLFDGGRTVNIAGGQHRLFALLGQVSGQLGAHGGFTGALQAAKHDDGWNRRGPVELCIGAAHQLSHLFIDDADNLLAGSQGGEYVGADTALRDLADKILGHGVVDVSFQEGHAHFPHAFLHSLFRQPAAPGHFPQSTLELFA